MNEDCHDRSGKHRVCTELTACRKRHKYRQKIECCVADNVQKLHCLIISRDKIPQHYQQHLDDACTYDRRNYRGHTAGYCVKHSSHGVDFLFGALFTLPPPKFPIVDEIIPQGYICVFFRFLSHVIY